MTNNLTVTICYDNFYLDPRALIDLQYIQFGVLNSSTTRPQDDLEMVVVGLVKYICTSIKEIIVQTV